MIMMIIIIIIIIITQNHGHLEIETGSSRDTTDQSQNKDMNYPLKH